METVIKSSFGHTSTQKMTKKLLRTNSMDGNKLIRILDKNIFTLSLSSISYYFLDKQERERGKIKLLNSLLGEMKYLMLKALIWDKFRKLMVEGLIPLVYLLEDDSVCNFLSRNNLLYYYRFEYQKLFVLLLEKARKEFAKSPMLRHDIISSLHHVSQGLGKQPIGCLSFEMKLANSRIHKKFINMVKEDSKQKFNEYFKKNYKKLKEWDIYNRKLEESFKEITKTEFDEMELYDLLNNRILVRGYFVLPKEKHYMFPFVNLLGERPVGEADRCRVLLWNTKILLGELGQAISMKKNSINFYGLMSLIFNLNAFFIELMRLVPKERQKEVCKLEEFQLFKSYFMMTFMEELKIIKPNKTARIQAASSTPEPNHQIYMKKPAPFSVKKLKTAQMKNMNFPNSFTFEKCMKYVRLFTDIK